MRYVKVLYPSLCIHGRFLRPLSNASIETNPPRRVVKNHPSATDSLISSQLFTSDPRGVSELYADSNEAARLRDVGQYMTV